MGVLMLSYEVAEVMMLADRVLVLYQGEIVSEYGQQQMNKETILADLAGVEK